ncbi:hypothetical protein HY792_05285 [Candidatus Desantisbacteria bacterium]|nr:hypothetical protein [Candidatus Desantisbacteria bacterium]
MKLNSSQRTRIANILTDTGKIVFAASVISPIFQGMNIHFSLVLTGIAISICTYLVAIYFEKEN